MGLGLLLVVLLLRPVGVRFVAQALAPPPPYSESAQFDAGGWHVPARVGAGAGEASAATVVVRRPAPGALAWLCCAPARAFEVSNKSE